MAAPVSTASGGLPIMGFFRLSATEMMRTGDRYFAINTGGVLQHENVDNMWNGGMGIQTDETGGFYILNGTPLGEPLHLNPTESPTTIAVIIPPQ